MVKNLPANAGDVRNTGLIPGQEDSLEEEMATYSTTLAWEILCTEEPVWQSTGSQTVKYNLATEHTHIRHSRSVACCCLVAQSCLTLCNPMDCSTPGLPVPHHHFCICIRPVIFKLQDSMDSKINSVDCNYNS